MKAPVRLLAIGHSYVVRENRSIVRELARDPTFQVTVVAPKFFRDDLEPIAVEDEPAGSPLEMIPIDAWGTSRIHLFRYDAAALRRLLDERQYDVVDVWEEPYIYAGYQIARLCASTPMRLSFWTMQNIVKRYWPPFGFFERATLARAQGWIACGRLVYETMMARGYPPARGRVLPLAVDPGVFHPLAPASRETVLAELGLRAPVVGFVGRLVASKGLDILMDSLGRLPGRIQWDLLVLGSGPYRTKIEAWAARLDAGRRARVMLAKHRDVARYLSAMDVLVAPSRTTRGWREQFGRMLIEAMSCGVPVIGSDSGEIPFVLDGAGRVVGEEDVEAYARALIDVLTDRGTRTSMIQGGLERARHYSVQVVAEQYREFYRWLAEQPVQS